MSKTLFGNTNIDKFDTLRFKLHTGRKGEIAVDDKGQNIVLFAV
jgi:hypothetical protein